MVFSTGIYVFVNALKEMYILQFFIFLYFQHNNNYNKTENLHCTSVYLMRLTNTYN